MLKIICTAPNADVLRQTVERAAKFLAEGHDLASATVGLPGGGEFRLEGEPGRAGKKGRKPRKPSKQVVRDWPRFWGEHQGRRFDAHSLSQYTGCSLAAAKQAIRLALKRGQAEGDADGTVRVLDGDRQAGSAPPPTPSKRRYDGDYLAAHARPLAAGGDKADAS
jgi:hypothetical protein